jgi:metal-dependent amidase/aminoacylase/carboxypeptidase family protein
VFRRNLHALGATEMPEIKDRLGSSDVGNVSQVLPCIQPMMKIAPDGTPIHSREFAAAAVTAIARDGTLKAAKAMARTTYDLLAEPALLAKATEEFRTR